MKHNPATTSIDSRILRLAFVQNWSDALLQKALATCESQNLVGDAIFDALSKAADNFNLSILRNGDTTLARQAAQALGFESATALAAFMQEHPVLSAQRHAAPALSEGEGTVVAMSLTETVMETAGGQLFAFERAQCPGAAVGDVVTVGRFGRVDLKR